MEVAGTPDPRANSHIRFKRMGDYLERIVFRIFSSLDPTPNLSICNEIFGLKLSSAWFYEYELGFSFVSLVSILFSHLLQFDWSLTIYCKKQLPSICHTFVMNQSTWSLYSNQGRYPSLGATMLLFPAYFAGAMSSACSRDSLIATTKMF